MRIWSLHPKYLDTVGLVALWRETLLAKHVLEGKTKGYVNHPQLKRFKACSHPLKAINQYLEEVYKEAQARQYNFDDTKFERIPGQVLLPVTEGQVKYEFSHLLKKLRERDTGRYNALVETSIIDVHAIFTTIPGSIEPWELLS
jgi:IS30 family transposase